jgi:hypothetical protein
MNKQRKLQISIITILACTSLGVATAQSPFGAEGKGQEPRRYTPQPATGGMVDPATGLPITPPQPEPWMDSQWKDPEKKLTVSYDGLPLSEVAADLRKQFDDAFDIVLPRSAPIQVLGGIEALDVSGLPIQIRLKDVRASEVFNALNLMFEAETTPLRWELKMNGSRPLALLRARPEAAAPLVRTEPPQRKVFFVGDLVTGEKGGMSMEQLVKTVSEIYEMSYGTSHGPGADQLRFHKDAQLVVVTGSVEQISFIADTISALKQKVEHSAQAPGASAAPDFNIEPKAKTDKPKSS